MTETQRKQITGMACYWREVMGRENQDVLWDELRTVVNLLGVSKTLMIIADYAKREKPTTGSV